MVGMITSADVTALPLEPKNPLPYWRRLAAARRFDMGLESLRDAGGPVTRNVLAPRWVMPPSVFVSSPQGARDVLGRRDAFAERGATPMAVGAASWRGIICWSFRTRSGCHAGGRSGRFWRSVW